jgi:hypothetical protein
MSIIVLHDVTAILPYTMRNEIDGYVYSVRENITEIFADVNVSPEPVLQLERSDLSGRVHYSGLFDCLNQ